MFIDQLKQFQTEAKGKKLFGEAIFHIKRKCEEVAKSGGDHYYFPSSELNKYVSSYYIPEFIEEFKNATGITDIKYNPEDGDFSSIIISWAK